MHMPQGAGVIVARPDGGSGMTVGAHVAVSDTPRDLTGSVLPAYHDSFILLHVNRGLLYLECILTGRFNSD